MNIARSNTLAGFWLLLLLGGQAATLRLILAGHMVRYQHFVSADRRLAELPFGPVPVLAFQALCVVAGLIALRGDVARMVRRVGSFKVLLALAAMVLTSAALTRDVPAYVVDVAISSATQLLHLSTAILLGLSLPLPTLEAMRRRAERVLGAPNSSGLPEPGGLDRFAWLAAAWVLLVTVLLAVLVYQRHPHVPDETVYLLHAKYLARFHLSMPLPPAPGAFNIDLMTYEPTRWYSPVPPGWPLALAAGTLLGVPWLVNPVLAGANVLLGYLALRECYPRRTARLATLLFCVSPWQLFLAMSFMTHTWTLTCALAAAAAVGRLRRDPRARWAILGGAAIGMVSLIRPLEGLIVALLMGLWSLSARGRSWRFAPSAVLTLATTLAGAIALPYNKHLTGKATDFPIEAYTRALGRGSNALGFGPDRGLGWLGLDAFPGHGWKDVLVNTNLNLSAVNTELLGWSTGAVVLLALFAFGGRLRKADWWMVAVIFAVTTAHHFYWFAGGPDFGARYWYLVIVPCLALAARAIEWLEELAGGAAPPGRGSAVTAAAAALVLGTLLLFVPWRAGDKYWHYRRMEPGVTRLARHHAFGRSLVLVRGDRHPDYASAAPYNPLDLTADAPVYAWDRRAEERDEALRAYPDRPVWFVDGPGLTGGGWRVFAGPLTADQARRVPGYWQGH